MATDAQLVEAPGAELVQAYNKLMRMLLLAQRSSAQPEFVAAQLREASRQLRRVAVAEAKLTGIELPRSYGTSAAAADTTLGGVGNIRGALTGFEQAALRQLQDRVANELFAIRQTLQTGLALGTRGAARQLQRVIEGDNRLVETDTTGQLKVRTPSGRLWGPRQYARMLARTGIADARREAFGQRYLSNGVDLVRVVANGTLHNVCKRWEGVVLSLTGATPGFPTVGQARADGLFHPNCRHRYVAATDMLARQTTPPRVASIVSPLPILGRRPRLPRPRLPASTLRAV